MTRRQTLNTFRWWADWWRGLSAFEQLFVEVVGALAVAVFLAEASMVLWPG
jgi:hypothetical protein